MARRRVLTETPVPTKPRPRRESTSPRPAARPAAAERPIDMGGLDDFIGYAIRRAQLAAFQTFRERMADLAITAAQFSVMRLARDNPGLNQTALANALGAETSRMVLILDDLERRGLILRLASTVDRRSRAIFLAPEGRKLLRTIERRGAAHERLLVRRLRGDDKKTLLRMLHNLATPT